MSRSKFNATTETVVIGGGPAGLAAGYYLQAQSRPYVILDKAPTAGSSWRAMPTNLKLVSPWKANTLPGTGLRWRDRHKEISGEAYAHYLERYVVEHQLQFQGNTRVARIEAHNDGTFELHTENGSIVATSIINATGYFTNPCIPRIPGSDSTNILQLHSAQLRDAGHLKSRLKGNKIMIVGKRLTAGQIMVELVDAGFDVVLAHRSPIEFGVGPTLWWFLFRLFPLLEKAEMKLPGKSSRPTLVKMQGGKARRYIESSRVKTTAEPIAFEREEVLCADGSRWKVDGVIYATGFRPALAHLASLPIAVRSDGLPQLKGFESVSHPGLYFLGLDGARNFQSRFIRGIREDARELVEQLNARRSRHQQASVQVVAS